MKQSYEYINTLMISSPNSIADSFNDLNYIADDTESKYIKRIALAILIFQCVLGYKI